jgi:hypothetical protein
MWPGCRVLSLSQAELLEHAPTINAAAEFCAWMVWYYVSDRTTLLPFGSKSYSRDIFATSFAVIVVAAFSGTTTKEKKVMTLSRHQTEEWKGWMQVHPPCLALPVEPWKVLAGVGRGRCRIATPDRSGEGGHLTLLFLQREVTVCSLNRLELVLLAVPATSRALNCCVDCGIPFNECLH